jgi:cell division protein ZapE
LTDEVANSIDTLSWPAAPAAEHFELRDWIAALPSRPDGAELVEGFRPPARFADKDFAGYAPRHASQETARARLEAFTVELAKADGVGMAARLRAALPGRRAAKGVYLDGGFGVGKTHLLAALWNAAPAPKSYLSFDELVFYLGLVGVAEARRAFADRKLIAVDEWELDDPGNLKLALAFLRGALADGVRVAVTSNTLPIELGAGRFSQKDFRAEIEELAGAFEVIRIEGEDYRHRHFEVDPGVEYFADRAVALELAEAAGPRALCARFDDLLRALGTVHPIRYASLVDQISSIFLIDLQPMTRLPDALRWVHFVDTLYDSAVPMTASSEVALSSLFPESFVIGPFGKKLSRCLSRMEELLSERRGMA